MDKATIMAADDRRIIKVSCPEWRGHVYLREMDGTQRDSWEKYISQFADGKVDDLSTRLLVLTLVDEDGAPVFDMSELDQLKTKNGQVISRLALQAAELCSLDADAIDNAEAELKNA